MKPRKKRKKKTGVLVSPNSTNNLNKSAKCNWKAGGGGKGANTLRHTWQYFCLMKPVHRLD